VDGLPESIYSIQDTAHMQSYVFEMQQDHLAYLKSQKQEEILARDRENKRIGKMVVDDEDDVEMTDDEEVDTVDVKMDE
jgi:hypothetical protein